MVFDQNEFSDHSAIDFTLSITCKLQGEINGKCTGKIAWDKTKSEQYKQKNLSNPLSITKFEEMMYALGNVGKPDLQSTCIQTAVECFTKGGKLPLFLRFYGNRDQRGPAMGPPWDDSQWRESKKYVLRSRDRYKKSSTDCNQRVMVNSRKLHKDISR